MASLPPSLTTELQAVNVMLSVIGEAPVNQLEGANISDVATARNILAEVSKEVQSKGWDFNTEDNYPLVPDVDGNICLPANIARVAVDITSYPDHDFVQRGLRLYDKKQHTYEVPHTVEAKIVLILDFEEMPEPFRRYVTIKASRIFQDRTVGSDTLHGFSAKDEAVAYVAMVDADADSDDATIFDAAHMQVMIRRR